MNYVVFDIETTGLNPKYEKIIELGAAKVRDAKVVDTFSTFVNPGKSLPERIKELTGICDTDVINAPYIEEVLDRFIAFVGDDILLGHNLIFDYSFVKKAAVNQKKTFARNGIDTLKIARRFLNDLESRNLSFLCDYYSIHLQAHRALNDALATHELYQRLVTDFAEKDAALFQPKELVYNVKKEGPITPKQYALLLKLAKQYHFETCTDGQTEDILLEPIENITTERIQINRLTKNEASRLIDHILSTFGR
ncbi:MAG: 3'-5' exonuclease [Lachnospiraceae bacterium]|nr:3'-5' exonuclease [Lachnospiraceae bacterium]